MNKTEGNKMIAEFMGAGYSVDLDGSVFSIKRGKHRKLYPGTSGYCQVNASIGGKQKTYLLHRLVAAKYLPNPENLPEVNHKDGNKLNNHLENLEWCSRSANIQHGFKSGLITPPWLGKSGNLHHRSKSVQQLGETGDLINTFGSIREAGRITGISSKVINDCLTGRLRKAGGYKWKYSNNQNNPS